MTYYLCSVSNQSPENYVIGVRAKCWGVQEKYAYKLNGVDEGDTLVFVVGGFFRSIHKIESAPFVDDAPLWPPNKKDGS